MKRTIVTLVFSTLFVLTLFAQPAAWLDFPPMPAPNGNGALQGDVLINGVAAMDGSYIAAFSMDGVLVGASPTGQAGGVAYFSMLLYEKDADNPDLMVAGENFTLRVWDADTQQQYEYGSPLMPIGPYSSQNGAQMPNLTNISTGQPINNSFTTNTLDFTVALPVELASFNINKRDCGQHELSWTTVSELNNDYFTLERSIGSAFKFEEIARIDAIGNSQQKEEYTYLDKMDVLGKNDVYYRLSQTDFDGTKTVFNMVYVEHNCGDTEIVHVYPNPTRNNFKIAASSDADLSVEVFNAMGQKIYAGDVTRAPQEVVTTDWDNGLYLINIIEQGNIIQSSKLIKN